MTEQEYNEEQAYINGQSKIGPRLTEKEFMGPEYENGITKQEWEKECLNYLNRLKSMRWHTLITQTNLNVNFVVP